MCIEKERRAHDTVMVDQQARFERLLALVALEAELVEGLYAGEKRLSALSDEMGDSFIARLRSEET